MAKDSLFDGKNNTLGLLNPSKTEFFLIVEGFQPPFANFTESGPNSYISLSKTSVSNPSSIPNSIYYDYVGELGKYYSRNVSVDIVPASEAERNKYRYIPPDSDTELVEDSPNPKISEGTGPNGRRRPCEPDGRPLNLN